MTYQRKTPRALEQREIDRHAGTADDFLIRHTLTAKLAALGGPAAVRDFLPHLVPRIADFRNLRAAWNYPARQPDAAPGPNGHRFDDFVEDEVHALLRRLENDILAGQFRAGPERIVQIPKGPGREGTRPLSLLKIEDRVVQRGAVQIVQPLLDPMFDTHSFGGRPGRGPWSALARAKLLAEQEQRLVWLPADISNFYGEIPVSRLLQVIHKYLPSGELQELIRRLTTRQAKGLAQGAPLSTLLANFCGNHFLDRPWRRERPETPLLRFIDDFLVQSRNRQEAEAASELLERLVRCAGLSLKSHGMSSIHDLSKGESVDWLGYRLSSVDRRIVLGLLPDTVTGEPAGAWLEHMRIGFALAHEKPDAVLRAWQVIEGSIDHMGPCWRFFDLKQKQSLYQRMVATARDMGIEEVPAYFEFKARARSAYNRWQRVCRLAMQERDLEKTAVPKVPVASRSAAVPVTRYVLHTDGAWFGHCRRGGWAFSLSQRSSAKPKMADGVLRRGTNNRAELTAVIKGLSHVPAHSIVHLICDSRYVVNGIRSGLARWKANGWRTGRPGRFKPLKNQTLWKRLEGLLAARSVTCEWVRGHSGVAANEDCDMRARQAALLGS